MAKADAVLVRAQQDAVWARTDAYNKVRSLLREFYPAILLAFATKRGGLLRPEARALLAAVPTPRAAARLTMTQLRAVLRRAGLQRGLDAEAERLHHLLRADYLHHPPLVEEAFGHQALALLCHLDTADDLAAATAERFVQHPDAAIIQHARPRRPNRRAGSWPRSATAAPGSPKQEASRPTLAARR